MGSSGGSYLPTRPRPSDLAQRTRDAEKRERTDRFDSQVSSHLADLLTGFNERDVRRIQSVISDVQERLGEEISGSTDVLFGGSVAKHTYVNGISDVDALVLFDRTELAHTMPPVVRSLLASCLRDVYGSQAVTEGDLAVTVRTGGLDIQFLPALRRGDSVAIPSSTSDRWSRIDPKRFTQRLTTANTQLSGKLVPCIKLVKALIGQLPEQQRLTGYHVEALAIRAFEGYTGPKTSLEMLRYFFREAPKHIERPIHDQSGQSDHVDDYLGDRGSLRRRIATAAVDRLGRKIRNADGALSVSRWRNLFD